MKTPPKIAIIITTYNQGELLFGCLNSLERKTHYRNYKVFIVDDSGEGKIGKEIKRKYGRANITINKTNEGFSKANNKGIKKAIKTYNPDYVLLLNDDCEIVDKFWLAKMVDSAEKEEQAGILGCKLVYSDGSLQWIADNSSRIHFFTSRGKKDFPEETSQNKFIDNIIGACFLIKRKVIDSIGFLDEVYSPFYAEETDFCYRAKKKGFKCLYVAGTRMIHHRNSSISKKENNYVWYIKKRNSITLEWRHFAMIRNIKHTIIHFCAIFYDLEKNRFNRDFPYKFYLLIKAYVYNLKMLF